jgi:hypothetical protein
MISFINKNMDTFLELDVRSDMTLVDLKAFISAKFPHAPADTLSIYYGGELLWEPTRPLQNYGMTLRDVNVLKVEVDSTSLPASSLQGSRDDNHNTDETKPQDGATSGVGDIDEGMVTETMKVPIEAVGMIIGKGLFCFKILVTMGPC